MHKTRLARCLSRLMPADTQRELFDPALADLHADAARTGRSTILPTIGLFLECWRLAPAEVLAMFLHDVRHALRLLVREPGFTLAAVLTLALGVGGNVAVFAIVNAVLLRPLPYPSADDLVVLQHRDRQTGITKDFIAMGDFVDLRARQHAFESIAAYGWGRSTMLNGADPFDVVTLQATPDLFDLLRVHPVSGRLLTSDDAKGGAAQVVVLGYQTWQTHFGGDPAVVGRAVQMGDVARQIVGVAPPGFRFPANARTDAIVPMTIPSSAPAVRKSGWVFGVGRLRRGTTLDAARADLAAIARQMEAEFPTDNEGSEYQGRTLREAMVGDTKRALVLLLAAVGVVLLIACVNVANLLVARGLGRRQETAVRVALGAPRRRLVAQSLAESLVLATAGAIAGLLAASLAMPALVSLVPADVHLDELATVSIDVRVLVFTVAVTLLITTIFGVLSAFGMRVDNAAGVLVSPARVTDGIGARRASAALVVVETALAIVLLSGAGLVLRSFSRLLAVDPGFRGDHVLTLEMALPSERYKAPGSREAFFARAFDDVRHVGGVQAVGAATVMPLTGNNWSVPFDRADRPVPGGQRPPDVGWQAATGGYFSALQIPLLAGRLFDSRDRGDGQAAVIISEAIRDRFYRGEDPVGRRVKLGTRQAEIVGVVGNIRRAALTDEPRADMYFSIEQGPSATTTLFIRTAGDPRAALAPVRDTLRRLEPLVIIRDVVTMDDVARESLQITRLAMWLLGVFAASALALAAVGIYGVMAYSVRQRTRELGTRLALGATPRDIVWLVMRDGIRVAALGAGIGLLVGAGARRAMASLLFGTSPSDPATLAASTALLLAVALLACYLPARRATRLDARESLIPNR